MLMARKTIECINCSNNNDIESLADCIIVNGKVARIPGLERIMDRVMKMRLESRTKVANELLRLVKQDFIVPTGEEDAYRQALLDDYEQRLVDFA
jgi:hypothetical protein